VADPGGVVERDAERPGDVEAVRPVLGQPGRRQRRRLERRLRPEQPAVGIGGKQGRHGRAPRRPPSRQHDRRCRPLGLDLPVDRRIEGLTTAAPRRLGARHGTGGHRCHDRLLGLGEVQHDVGDRPARRARFGRPRRRVEGQQDLLEAVLLGDEIVEDLHRSAAQSSLRSSRRMILPVEVFGRSATKRTERGSL
jgi:hypothetical protein